MLRQVVKLLKLHLLNISSRQDVSFKHIHGSGLEIGAMHFPLPVHPGVCVKYVDANSRQENINRHPEIDGSKVVETDYLEDGFILKSIEDNSVDFVIANHVLEHSCDPFGAMLNWSRVLKSEGVIFVTVPNYIKCFDKGRSLTCLEHLVEDYFYAKTGEKRFLTRNREHYKEWLEISLPNARNSDRLIAIPKTYEVDAWIDDLSVHFHTFTYATFKMMLKYYTSKIDDSMKLVNVYNGQKRFEFIAILQKLPAGQVKRYVSN